MAIREEGEMTINYYPRKQTTTEIQRVLRHHGWLTGEVGPSELFLVENTRSMCPVSLEEMQKLWSGQQGF